MSLTQQKRLYEAEACLWGHGREFDNVVAVGNYLDSVINSWWFINQFGYMHTINVQGSAIRGYSGAADRTTNTIYLKRMTENVVLHELAHLVSETDNHDNEFVANFLFLIRNAMGFYSWAEFSFELNRSSYWEAM